MPDILTPTTSATAAKYSYYLVDIVTNTTLAQIPFEDVSYERSLKQAGQFTGKITTTQQTDNLDLYNSTMPGKTALYVMRNDKCVWGGIVWSRGYDMVGRSLTVSASEFTSYFNRRHIWKTYTYSFEAELTKINKTDRVKVSLKNKTLRVPFATQDSAGNKTKVYVSFSDANLIKYGDYYNIVQDDSSQEPTQTTFYVNIPKLPASASVYAGVTISARVDTYDYVRELLKDIAIDFSDVDFTNETITPGVKQQSTITYRSCSDNEVTVTTSEKHNFVTGQVVDIKNLEKALNGKYKVTSIPTPYQFKYSIPVYNIKYVKREDNIATVYVNTLSGTNIVKIPVGASIVVAATTYTSFNGTKTVVSTTDNSFSYVDVGGNSGGKLADTGSITVPNIAINGSELNPTNYRVNSRKIQSTGPKGVTHVIRQAGKVTMWTKTDHGFKKADKVAISIKVTSSDKNDKYASLNNSDIPIVVTSVTSRSFSYYQDNQSDTKNDIKNKDDSRVELKTTKKNTARLAVPVKKLILKTVDTHTYEVGDYLYVGGVDGYDWTTPLYNGYKTIEELDTDSATIRNRERSSGGKTTIYTADNHGYDVGDMVVISGMADATFNGTFKIISVYDPANASNGEACFRFYGVAGAAVAKAGSNSNYGTANTYGDSWVAFGMPEYGTVKEPDDIIPLSKRSYSTTGRIVTMFTSKRHGLSVGDKIRVDIDADKNEVYKGLFVVQTVPREDYFTYKLGEDAKNLPTIDFKYQEIGGSITRVESKVGFYPRVSVTIGRVGRKANTATIYANSHPFIVGDSITVSMSNATYNSFENSENTFKVTEVIDDDHFTYASTGSDVGKVTINRKQRTGNTVTLRTSSSTHNFTTGEYVYVSGVQTALNGSYKITGTASNTFTYTTSTSGTIAQTVVSSANAIAHSTIAASGTAYIDYQPHGTVEEVTYAVKIGTAATLTIEDHPYSVGDYVVVYIYTASKAPYNNDNKPVRITSVTANTISYTATSATSVAGASVTGRVSYSAQVEKRPIVVGRTYGEFPENSDLGGLDFSETTYSNNTYQNSIIRGSDLTNVAQLLETYSNTTNGFDYRVDCSVDYDQYGNKIFKRSFTLIPRTPVSLSDYLSNLPDGKLSTGTYAPPSAFGADKYVFEYPGNVSNFNMSENSSDSATRVFVVGSNDDLGGEGGARFSAASATDLLNAGWPILDKSEKQEWPLVGINVINVDNWGNYDAELDFNKTAERYLNESKPPMGDFVVTVNGSLNPVVGAYNPGDWCSLRINDAFFKSRLASILEPRKDVVVRKIDTIKVNVPNNPAFPEQIDLTLVPEWQVDSVGK
jgi:hypothetical protein